VLKNGWALWAAEKLPVAKGSGGSSSPAGAAPAPKAVQKAPAPKAQLAPAPKAPQTGQTQKMSKASASKTEGPDKGQDKLCTDCTN